MGFGQQRVLDQEFLVEKEVEVLGGNSLKSAIYRKLFPFDRSAQEKLAGIQSKLQNKNLSNKRRKELKKSKSKIASEEKKRATKETKDDAELVITNIQTLTI